MAGTRQLGLVSMTTAVAALCAIALLALTVRGRYEGPNLVVTWKQGTGTAHEVTGIVTRKGEPVVNEPVFVINSEKTIRVVTDPQGRFLAADVGGRLLEVRIGNVGRIVWADDKAPSTRDGVELTVEVKL